MNNEPNHDNAESLGDYISLEKQLQQHLRHRADIMEEISGLDSDLERKVMRRLEQERKLIKAQARDYKNLAKEYHNLNKASTEAERAQHLQSISGLEQRIRGTAKEASILKQLHAFEISTAKDKATAENKYRTLGNSLLAKTIGLTSRQSELQRTITSELKDAGIQFGKWAGLFGGLLYLIKSTVGTFLEFDRAGTQFRKTLGFIRGEFDRIETSIQDLTVQNMNLGVTIDDVVQSLVSLGQEMGGVHTVSKDLLRTTNLLNAQLDIGNEITAGFLRNLASMGKTTMEAQTTSAFIAKNLSSAAGVPLDTVMRDVAKMSGTTLSMISKYPSTILRTAVEARRLNTSIEEIARASRELLNFSESINAEMEASVLLGRNINLQRARELAYRGQLEASTREILGLTKRINFESLDPFQMEAFARATGRSVEELLKMTQAERELDRARRDPSLQKQVFAYERLREANQEVLKSNARNLDLMIQQKSNQERLASISQKWSQIMASASKVFLPIVDAALSIVPPMLTAVNTMFSLQLAGLGASKVMAFMSGAVSKVGAGLGKVWSIAGKVFAGISKFGGVLGFLGKWVPVVGQIVAGLQFVGNLFRRLDGIGQSFKEGVLTGIWHGIKAIGGALYDTLIQPFVDGWNWIRERFVGNSPSMLGLGIVRGLVGVQGMVLDAITMPFRDAFRWVTERLSGLNGLVGKVLGGINGGLVTPKEKLMSMVPTYVPAVQVSPVAIPTVQRENPKVEKSKNEESSKLEDLMSQVVEGLSALRKDLNSGKLVAATYLDSQLVSTYLARNLEFSGGFGVNK